MTSFVICQVMDDDSWQPVSSYTQLEDAFDALNSYEDIDEFSDYVIVKYIAGNCVSILP